MQWLLPSIFILIRRLLVWKEPWTAPAVGLQKFFLVLAFSLFLCELRTCVPRLLCEISLRMRQSCVLRCISRISIYVNLCQLVLWTWSIETLQAQGTPTG